MQPALQPDNFDQIVADMYRAAAGEVPWGQPFQGMVEAFQAWGVYLHGVRLADGAVVFGYEVGGFPPEAALEYLRRYHRDDPRMGLLVHLQPGQWTSCHDHFNEAWVARNAFYQDFLIPVGGRYCSGAKVYQDDELVVFLGIHRGVGSQPLGAAELGLASRFSSHLQIALGLWRRQRELLKVSLAGNALLDRLSQPVLLVDEQLQLHYKNGAAQRLLGGDTRLRESGSSLACADAAGTRALMLALRRIRLGGDASYKAVGEPEQRALVRVGDRTERLPLMLLMSALRPEENMGAFGPRSLALVIVHDPDAQRQVDPFIVAEAYQLTPAESAVAIGIAAGKTVREIAHAHRVVVATVRTQISSVLAKMGVRRQSEIAGTLAAFPLLAAPS